MGGRGFGFRGRGLAGAEGSEDAAEGSEDELVEVVVGGAGGGGEAGSGVGAGSGLGSPGGCWARAWGAPSASTIVQASARLAPYPPAARAIIGPTLGRALRGFKSDLWSDELTHRY
jgi:hypothetical protein